MAKTYKQIQEQIESLQREAEALKAREVGEVVERIKEAIAAYGLTADDLGFGRTPRAAKKAAVKTARRTAKKGAASKPSAAKYRDEQGNTWVGRGKRPQWLRDALAAGRSLEDFATR